MRLQVIDIPNSMTVLPELLPYSIEMVSFSALPYLLIFSWVPCAAYHAADAVAVGLVVSVSSAAHI